MAIELATAYVSIAGSTKQLETDIRQGVARAERNLTVTPKIARGSGHQAAQGFFQEFQSAGDRIGAGIGAVIGKSIGGTIRLDQRVLTGVGHAAGTAIKTGLLGVLAGAGLSIGGILFKGFERLESLDKSRKQLERLGIAAGDVKTIMDDVNAVVKDTPIALNDALGEVPRLLAAGIQSGKQMTDVLTAMADAAGFSGDRFTAIAEGFDKIINTGKLTGEELQNQFRNLPLVPWLAKSMGTDPASIMKMISDGKIGIQQVVAAVEQGAGGMAKAAGETIEGAMQNAMTAAARVGANLIAAAFGGDSVTASDNMVNAIKQISGKFDELSNWVVAHRDEIHTFFEQMGDIAKDVANALGNVLNYLTQHPGAVKAAGAAFATWEAISVVSTVAAGLNSISTLLRVTIPADAAAGGAATGAGFTSGLAAGGWILKAGVWTLPLAIAYSIIWGDRDVNPQTQTSGGPGQPQLPGVYGSGGPPTQIPSAAQPGLFGPSATGSPVPQVPHGGRSGPGGTPSAALGPLVGPGAGMPPGITTGGQAPVKGAAYSAMIRAGWGADQWPALDQIISHESGWQAGARNPTSGAYGLFQFLGHENDKYGAMGGYSADPAAQINAGMAYIADRYGSPAAAWAFWQANGWYDEGGWLPPGYQWVLNNTGQPELVLNQDQVQSMADQGVDPNTLVHGTGKGAEPGPPKLTPDQQQAFQAGMGAIGMMQQQGQGPTNTPTPRTVGYIPAAVQAGANTVAGTSSLAGILNLGNQVVHGLIDTGAEAAKMGISAAVSAGAGAGTFGAAAAAGPAASAAAGLGIDMAANIGKRVSTYGFQLLSIAADSAIENMFPFGAPRWIGYDYTQFMPSINLQPITAAVTTGEKAALAAQQQGQAPAMPPGNQHMPTGAIPGVPIAPGGPVSPRTMPGMQDVQGKPQGTQPALEGFTPGLEPGVPSVQQPPAPQTEPSPDSAASQFQDPNYWLNLFGFDSGGWLNPGMTGVNLSNRPEPVFTDAQWQTLQTQISDTPERSGKNFGVTIHNLYATDADDVKRQIDAQQKLAMMRYAGRP